MVKHYQGKRKKKKKKENLHNSILSFKVHREKVIALGTILHTLSKLSGLLGGLTVFHIFT